MVRGNVSTLLPPSPPPIDNCMPMWAAAEEILFQIARQNIPNYALLRVCKAKHINNSIAELNLAVITCATCAQTLCPWR
eukprot:358784-Chlamydomonas_euryale.AAC.12